MTPLRNKMICELELQRKAPSTVSSYVKAVEELARYYGRSPDAISIHEIRNYLHFLIVDKQLSHSSCNHKIAAINFFFREVLGRPVNLRVPMKRSGRLPEPLSREEVARLIEAAKSQKHRVYMMTAYSAGLRVSELIRLKPTDIHSDRMLIRVNQGKGRKDRYTLLSERLLRELRAYWREYRPAGMAVSQRGGYPPHADLYAVAGLLPAQGASRHYPWSRDPHAAAQLRNASAGSGSRSAHDPDPDGTQQSQYHAQIPSHFGETTRTDGESARSLAASEPGREAGVRHHAGRRATACGTGTAHTTGVGGHLLQSRRCVLQVALCDAQRT